MNNLFLYLVTVVIWGSTWIAINFQLGVVALEVSLVYRYLLAALLLFAWCRLRGHKLAFGVAAHRRFAAMGMLLFGFNYLATYSAQQYIPSALNAVAFSSMVWMNILNARWFFGTRLEPAVLVGAGLGIAGIVILFWPELRDFRLDNATLYGAGLSLAGAGVASFGNMVSQSSQRIGLPVVASNAWGMLYGAGLCAAAAWFGGEPLALDDRPSYWISLVYLAVFGSVVGFGCYLTLLGRIGAHRAGYAVVLFPVVAVALSWAFEGLTLTAHVLIGIALVLAGNAVILTPALLERRRRAAPATVPDRA